MVFFDQHSAEVKPRNELGIRDFAASIDRDRSKRDHRYG